MKNSWRIARILGIDIRIDASWILIFLYMVLALGIGQFPRELRPRAFFARPDAVSITLGVVASLLLFGSVLVHELAHSWMALRRGIPVVNITLFIFGGVAQIADEPDRPATEFLIAIMGPLMSAALAAVFGALWIWLQIIDAGKFISLSLLPAIALCGILAQVNLSLAVFNLAPGFPLDGGRVLRAFLWGWWHDLRRATLWAARAGQTLAVVFIAIGAWLIVRDANFASGIWLALIAVFLWTAAREGYRQINLREWLQGVRVEQMMLRDVRTIAADLSLAEFVGNHLFHQRDPAFAVMDGTGLRGLVSGDHLRRFPRAEWRFRCVAEAMTPLAELAPLAPYDNAAEALAKLVRTNQPELPVMLGGDLVGVLGQTEISRFLKLNR